jgi:hypothetical protein
MRVVRMAAMTADQKVDMRVRSKAVHLAARLFEMMAALWVEMMVVSTVDMMVVSMVATKAD